MNDDNPRNVFGVLLGLVLYVLLCLFFGGCYRPPLAVKQAQRVARERGLGTPLIDTCTTIADGVVRCTVYDGVDTIKIEIRD
jgi:hypothetical protein